MKCLVSNIQCFKAVWLGSLTENWPLLFLAVAALVLLQQEMLKAIMSDSRSRLPGVLLINLLALILCCLVPLRMR